LLTTGVRLISKILLLKISGVFTDLFAGEFRFEARMTIERVVKVASTTEINLFSCENLLVTKGGHPAIFI